MANRSDVNSLTVVCSYVPIPAALTICSQFALTTALVLTPLVPCPLSARSGRSPFLQATRLNPSAARRDIARFWSANTSQPLIDCARAHVPQPMTETSFG
jgi:hypothetical protein